MKRKYAFILVFVLLISFSVSKLEAKSEGMDNFAHVGVLADEFSLIAGVNVDIHMGSFLMLSPEAQLMVYKFKFDSTSLGLGCMLNVKKQFYFVGGGVTVWLPVGANDEYAWLDLTLKLNAGYVGDNFKLTVFFITRGAFGAHSEGKTVGVTFAFKF